MIQNKRLLLFGELEDYLDAWKESLPSEFQPEAQVDVNNPSHRFNIQSVLMLHMTYYYTVATIHRFSAFLDLDPELEQELKEHSTGGVDQAELSALVCLSASRTTVHLLRYGNCSFYMLPSPSWSTIYYVLAASLMIFANVVKNPTQPEVEVDISYLRLFAITLQRSFTGAVFPHGDTLRALAELMLSIAEPIVHHKQEDQQQQKQNLSSSALPESFSQHIPYAPAENEQPLLAPTPQNMPAGPSSAIPQDPNHGVSSTVNAAGSIFDYLFLPSQNPSPSPFLNSAGNADSSFPRDAPEIVGTLEGVGSVENEQHTAWDSYVLYD
ncbi:hypothetical protein N7499_002592 [Penicillium canescens]|nr:hypothetical protein N7499_002592 [Penicillium canescens]KAJ6166206.1 hypothetical protein N7485_009450 [Penicillium canescens]